MDGFFDFFASIGRFLFGPGGNEIDGLMAFSALRRKQIEEEEESQRRWQEQSEYDQMRYDSQSEEDNNPQDWWM